jgi:arsenate reductase
MRILFVCVGNSCRSQMAEGFARAYGSGVWEVESVGLMPATGIAPLTREVMEEKKVSLADHFPKGLDEVKVPQFDLVINLSGFELPEMVKVPVREWQVRDPIGQGPNVYRKVRDQIEGLVVELLREVRVGPQDHI